MQIIDSVYIVGYIYDDKTLLVFHFIIVQNSENV